MVSNDPRQLRFAFALWTRAVIRQLIRREFGVALSEVSVGRLLRKLGLSRSGRCTAPPSKSRGDGALEGRGVPRDP